MFCSNCGKEVSESSKFCSACGAVLHKAAIQSSSIKVPVEAAKTASHEDNFASNGDDSRLCPERGTHTQNNAAASEGLVNTDEEKVFSSINIVPLVFLLVAADMAWVCFRNAVDSFRYSGFDSDVLSFAVYAVVLSIVAIICLTRVYTKKKKISCPYCNEEITVEVNSQKKSVDCPTCKETVLLKSGIPTKK